MNSVNLIDFNLFNRIILEANESSRKRANYNFHRYPETYQRFLNVLTSGTYICPHKHMKPPKAETFIALKGEIAFFIFNEKGTVIEIHRLSSSGPKMGIDIQPDVWHSLLCISKEAVCFEGKTGPYDPSEDKIFASWAPKEGEPGTIEYMNSLMELLKE